MAADCGKVLLGTDSDMMFNLIVIICPFLSMETNSFHFIAARSTAYKSVIIEKERLAAFCRTFVRSNPLHWYGMVPRLCSCVKNYNCPGVQVSISIMLPIYFAGFKKTVHGFSSMNGMLSHCPCSASYCSKASWLAL